MYCDANHVQTAALFLVHSNQDLHFSFKMSNTSNIYVY